MTISEQRAGDGESEGGGGEERRGKHADKQTNNQNGDEQSEANARYRGVSVRSARARESKQQQRCERAVGVCGCNSWLGERGQGAEGLAGRGREKEGPD